MIKKLKLNWKMLLTDDEYRIPFQFTVVYVFFAVVSFVMTAMNYVTGWYLLGHSTLIFGILNVVNFLLALVLGTKRKLPSLLFSIEMLLLFTFFVWYGEPEGFSAIWAALLPTSGLLLYRKKNGSILAGIQFVILAFFLWTPFGRSLLLYDYTESFMMRFPVLYLAFYGAGLFFELVRDVTHRELAVARDKYKQMYTDEELRAEREKQRNYDIISILASEYDMVCYVDLEQNTVEPYTLASATASGLDLYFPQGCQYSAAFRDYIEANVFMYDKARLLNACGISNVRDMLVNQKTFSVIYRSDNFGDPHYCEIKFVKVGEEIGAPKAVAIALGDKDTEIRADMERQRELEEAKLRAEAANEAKSRFLFNMSHDIRTPMNAIIGFTDMAQKYSDDAEKMNDCLTKARNAEDHLLRLINDVLDMSRIDSGKVEIEETPSDLRECAEKLNEMVMQSAAEKHLDYSMEFENVENWYVYVDVLRMNQVMLNIISNSIKYTHPGGQIRFTVAQCPTEKEGYASYDFTVRDNGIGMSREFAEHIFDAFAREKTSTVSGIQGTGLGMSITKRLIDLMHGDIHIDSEPDEGTTVTVHVLLHIAEAPQEAEPEREAAVKAPISLEGKRILLVEDNMLNREIAKDILTDEGIKIETAEDGTVAVSMFSQHEPDYYDCILMDIQMPIMDGYTATNCIRSMTGGDRVPIIAVSANAFEEDRKKSIAAGMNDHIAKPISPQALIGALTEIL